MINKTDDALSSEDIRTIFEELKATDTMVNGINHGWLSIIGSPCNVLLYKSQFLIFNTPEKPSKADLKAKLCIRVFLIIFSK